MSGILFFSGVMSHDIRIVCLTSLSKLVDMVKVSGIIVCDLTYSNPKLVLFGIFEPPTVRLFNAETVALAINSDVKLH